MLTPEYLRQITEGAENISSSLHRNIMDMIIERMVIRIGKGYDYLLTPADKWRVMVLQDAGELLEDIEKEIAENTSVIISAMTLTSDDAGTVTLRIVSPDIKTALEGLAVDVANDDKADFADALSEELLLMFKNNSVSKRAEPFFVEADMKFVSNTWIIVPDDELFNALTADVNNLIDELYCMN